MRSLIYQPKRIETYWYKDKTFVGHILCFIFRIHDLIKVWDNDNKLYYGLCRYCGHEFKLK